MDIGAKIDFKVPGSGRGRPSVGTVQSVGAMITVVKRLGEAVEIDPSWVVSTHKGSYVRKEAAEA